MRKIAVFSSGNGTNAENLIEFFKSSPSAEVKLLVTNNSKAGVIGRGKRRGIPVFIFPKDYFLDGEKLAKWLISNHIDLIVLAGFLLKIPPALIKAFDERIVNIHPSLLPKYGGKGMFGDHVHKAVIDAGDHESGITIHLVNEEYDKGEILAQFSIPVLGLKDSKLLAQKIHELEHKNFPVVVSDYLQRKFVA
jgi:phosphoribosylglycinamide formyltransferase 1